jgi:beta-lactamase regulating signal transducer with metallopeptidase domain
MILFLWFTLKASICLILFYMFFVLFLRKSTFFWLNRIYLLTGLLLSLIIPLLKIPLHGNSLPVVNSALDLISGIESEGVSQQTPNNMNILHFFNFQIILPVIYIIGVSFMFIRLFNFLYGIIRLRGNSQTYAMGRIRIVKTQTVTPFSFFNIVFLPVDETDRMIMNHEMAHVRQHHWFDLVIAETVSLLLWFNPFVVLYKSSLKLQHEYLADAQVLRNSYRIEDYLACMLQRVQFVSTGGLVSPFFCKTIKKRVIMMTKNKTSVKHLWVYLLVIPLVGLLLAAFTLKSNPGLISDNKPDKTVVHKPSIYPVKTIYITRKNGYGEWINPISHVREFHKGIDLAAKEGIEVMATADGEIVEAKFDENSKKGNYVLIKHDETYSTIYAHLKSFTVKPGDQVKQGQVIGNVGNTGVSTGPHLHYEVICNNERVNPKDYLTE